MRNVCLTVKVSESLIYQYDETINGQCWRRTVAMRAAPNITWREILDELRYKEPSGVMETIMVLEDNMLVVLSCRAFRDIAKEMVERNLREKRLSHMDYFDVVFLSYSNLAKEMVTSRDYESNGGGFNRNHKWKDYWPKD